MKTLSLASNKSMQYSHGLLSLLEQIHWLASDSQCSAILYGLRVNDLDRHVLIGEVFIAPSSHFTYSHVLQSVHTHTLE